ncbi:hypothetical protein F4808DRAFT_58374 [Astrocystis sublimbata]|nr:hypothetical protein F4808DRAFT_58374 [Astrocystis sublimbata]
MAITNALGLTERRPGWRSTRSPQATAIPQSPNGLNRQVQRVPISPVSVKTEDNNNPPRTMLTFRDIPTGSLKRKSEDHSNVSERTLAAYPGNRTQPLAHNLSSQIQIIVPQWTPMASPEPSEWSTSPPPVQDLITDKLNCLRLERLKSLPTEQNSVPLPPLEALCISSRTTLAQEAGRRLASFRHQHFQPPIPLRQRRVAKRARTSAAKPPHNNLKYLVEELDFIRYQRVDCGLKWELVEAAFHEKFPTNEFPLPRNKDGLQGVNYRQNNVLPRIEDGELVFMDNGHVDVASVKTRFQTENKHLYTLVYLYPDRAMNYWWVSDAERYRARTLNVSRQEALERERLTAIERGTYVETLPTEEPCGCCPTKDRDRTPKKKTPCRKNLYLLKPRRLSVTRARL